MMPVVMEKKELEFWECQTNNSLCHALTIRRKGTEKNCVVLVVHSSTCVETSIGNLRGETKPKNMER